MSNPKTPDEKSQPDKQTKQGQQRPGDDKTKRDAPNQQSASANARTRDRRGRR